MRPMKKIILHGLTVKQDSEKYLAQIIDRLDNEGVEIGYTSLFQSRNSQLLEGANHVVEQITPAYDAVFSLGGDGTFLESLLLVGSSEVPILGINMGRLGFLASIAKEFIKESLYLFFKGKYEIESRSLLQLETGLDLFNGKTYALNECAILRKDTSAMIMVKCYINGQYLNTYWADGLMVATPTGSTGYSLSCGGPLMMPDSKDFIITPVSPHNLNVRPLIVSDDSELTFEIESRNRSKIEGINFPDTIRNKLGWGFDKRN